MKVYNYHPITKEYIGESLADESPLEPGIFLIPAHATNKEPPEQIEGKVRLFIGDSWQYADIPTNPEEIPVILTEEEKKAKQHQEILIQLDNLDRKVSRPLENTIKFLIKNNGYEPYQNDLNIIAEKESLREQLKGIV